MPRLVKGKSEDSNPIPAIPFRECVAKTDEHNRPGATVLEHCRHVGAVAGALMKRLPGMVTSLIPDGVVSLIAAHDLGKVSPGFQKKILPENSAIAALNGFDLAKFVKNHAEISEAEIKDYFTLNFPDNSKMENWAMVPGSHHGSRRKRPEKWSSLLKTCHHQLEKFWHETSIRYLTLRMSHKMIAHLYGVFSGMSDYLV